MRWLLAIVWVLACGPALAVTPQEVWADWQAQMARVGVHLTATLDERMQGTLTLRQITATIKRDGMYANGTIWELQLVQAKDGSVLVNLPVAPIKMQIAPHLANYDVTLTLLEGRLRISETNGALVYALTLQGVDLDYTGWSGSRDAKKGGALHSRGVALTVRLPEGPPEYSYDLSARELNYDLTSATPKRAEATQAVGSCQDIASQGSFVVPAGYADLMSRPDALASGLLALRRLLEGGMAARFALTVGASQDHKAQTLNGKTLLSWSEVGPGNLAVRMDKDGVGFDLSQIGGRGSSTNQNVDLQYGYGKIVVGVTWPLLGKGFEPFRLVFQLADMDFTPDWWAKHDPQGKVPHDKVQIDLSARGEVKMDSLRHILDEAQGRTNTPLPVFQTLTLDRLALSGFGATVQGSGAFRVDNQGPRPIATGKGEMRLTGIYTLLDEMQARGILVADQNMGARMVLLSLFRPSDDLANGLSSKVEARADGSVWVNGNRMR